jgi:hypothetical protein
MPTICNLKLITNVVLGKDGSKKLEVVGFHYAESVRKLLCFDVFLGGFLLVSFVSDVHS